MLVELLRGGGVHRQQAGTPHWRAEAPQPMAVPKWPLGSLFPAPAAYSTQHPALVLTGREGRRALPRERTYHLKCTWL